MIESMKVSITFPFVCIFSVVDRRAGPFTFTFTAWIPFLLFQVCIFIFSLLPHVFIIKIHLDSRKNANQSMQLIFN